MKASEILDAFEKYRDALNSLPDDSVIFGCDCGCGGDDYDYEEWKYLQDDFKLSEKNLKEVIIKSGIEWDIK